MHLHAKDEDLESMAMLIIKELKLAEDYAGNHYLSADPLPDQHPVAPIHVIN